MRYCLVFVLCLTVSPLALTAGAADSPIDLAARKAAPKVMEAAIVATLKDADLSKGSAVLSEGGRIFVATRAAGLPKLLIDEKPGPAMMKAGDFYYALATVETGRREALSPAPAEPGGIDERGEGQGVKWTTN
jgi:hypothetical protein